jgi:hypothetical protein
VPQEGGGSCRTCATNHWPAVKTEVCFAFAFPSHHREFDLDLLGEVGRFSELGQKLPAFGGYLAPLGYCPAEPVHDTHSVRALPEEYA